MRLKAIVLAVLPIVVLFFWMTMPSDTPDAVKIFFNKSFAFAVPVFALMSVMSLVYAHKKQDEATQARQSSAANIAAKVLSILTAMVILPIAFVFLAGFLYRVQDNLGLLG